MPHPSNSESGIVYVIRDESSGLHKIGITLVWQRRSRQLNIGTKTRAVCIVRAISPGEIERMLHQRYKSLRLPQSEWFNLQPQHITEIKQILIMAREEYKKKLDSKSSPRTPNPYSFSKFSTKDALHEPRLEVSGPAPRTSNENSKPSRTSISKGTPLNEVIGINSRNAPLSGNSEPSRNKPAPKSSSSCVTPALALFVGCLAVGYFVGGGNIFISMSLGIFALILLVL